MFPDKAWTTYQGSAVHNTSVGQRARVHGRLVRCSCMQRTRTCACAQAVYAIVFVRGGARGCTVGRGPRGCPAWPPIMPATVNCNIGHIMQSVVFILRTCEKREGRRMFIRAEESAKNEECSHHLTINAVFRVRNPQTVVDPFYVSLKPRHCRSRLGGLSSDRLEDPDWLTLTLSGGNILIYVV